VKPAPFKYVAPEDREEVLSILAEHGDDAKVLAGGQSLVPLMNLRLAKPAVVVDINRVRTLAGITVPSSGGITIGAMVRQAHLARARELQDDYQILSHSTRHIGHPGTRTRGTVGGSAAHADPAGELPTLLVTLGARLDVARATGTRTLAANEFFVSTFETALEDDELLTAIQLDPPPAGRRWAYEHVARRHGDFALVAVAVTADLDQNGICNAASIGIAGVAEVPLLATDAAQTLIGTRLGTPDAQAAGQAASEAVDPSSDVHASAEYRRRIVGVLVARAVQALSNGKSRR
jgi:CO/xanthine dehydrogenase FAD-binding subunit